ncbi:MAG TPA: 2-amino-4-hydroxy-6-hydroxymethyldihydropteridine diphosphokinase [Anaerolineales bacterium]
MSLHTVYLALGSNLGNRLKNLKTAIAVMQPGVLPDDCSPVYETPPWGVADQPPFLNQAVRGKTELEPEELLDRLKSVEVQMGREPAIKYGPRLIDVDILFYDDLVLDAKDLTVPHPRLSDRAFVLVPLADLAPDLSHPILNKTVKELLSEVDTAGIKWHAPGDCGKIEG